MRSISRVTGASRCAVNKLLLDAGRACAKYHNKKVRKIRAGKGTVRRNMVPISMPRIKICLNVRVWPIIRY